MDEESYFSYEFNFSPISDVEEVVEEIVEEVVEEDIKENVTDLVLDDLVLNDLVLNTSNNIEITEDIKKYYSHTPEEINKKINGSALLIMSNIKDDDDFLFFINCVKDLIK